MRIRPLVAAAAVLALLAATVRAATSPLAAEVGRARPLVVVAPGAPDPMALTLARELSRPPIRSALAERQVVVFTVLAGRGEREGVALDPAATAALLAGLGLRADGPAAALLVGKDGGVKLRRGRLSIAELLAAIDRMPMRRQEMRNP